jgi:hypothetical protein
LADSNSEYPSGQDMQAMGKLGVKINKPYVTTTFFYSDFHEMASFLKMEKGVFGDFSG